MVRDTSTPRACGIAVGVFLLAAAGAVFPGHARADLSVGAWIQHSPDDINTTNIPGLLTLSGNDATATATMPFSVTIGGTSYSTIVISTNGWIEFGANTQGTSDPTNAALPTSKHTNPFLAAYWDDLQAFGTNIRYGVVGTSPDRTYVVDFQADVNPAVEDNAADDMRFQVEIHESSAVINVHYDSTGHIANGQAATIGFQTAGGGGATAFPITFNGKILDDNRNSEGWSIDLHKTGAEALSAMMACSPDDIGIDTPAFATLSGDNAIAGVTMPFSVTIEGTSYSTLTIGTNGLVQFGTTTGANPATNASLPSATFPGPTLFWYWDDLQTEGSNIRYGTVGTSPNRTFIIDFQENLVASSGDKVNGQVQIHEGSNLLNVKYRSTLSANANGQSATIGFQGAGGASAAAYPLTFNGKVLDDNRPDEGWSVHAQATKDVSLHALHEFSPDDISGFTSLSGDNAIAGVTLPFSVLIDGVSYNTATIGTNGLVQFGTTTGANPTTNTALPSASFPNPTLFWYWDDLQPFSSNIEYATVGTSPNRTFIIDFQENRVGDTGNVVNGQVQIHETSSEMNVQYRSTMSAGANGQSATIGFQGAGGASAKAYPLTFNGKILDDNLPDAGWSVSPLRYCGDGIVQAGTPFGEQCDLGAANGTAGSCCTASCTFASSSTNCRAAAGECDLVENCTGTSATCPADAKVPNGTACTADANPCTLDQCDGTNVTCQHPFGNAGATCRAAATICDVAETCPGTGNCPADAFAASSTVCRSSAGVCDLAENCTGTSAACPADAKSTAVCRAAVGTCDVAESCNGVTDDCPADAVQPGTVVCRGSAGVCDPAESCTGSTALCPPDAKSTAVCRASAGICDVAESCDGVADDCPANGFESTGTTCRAAAGVCDVAESCTGTSAACPADALRPSTFECRSSAGVCDPAESCTGSTVTCPPDTKSTAECRPAAGDCDVAETCDGTNDACPADTFQSSTTTCRASAGVCDPGEQCTGTGATCPADAKSTAICRAAAHTCDAAESCDGTSNDCPPDVGQTGGTICRASAGACDVDEVCDGSNSVCPADALQSSSAVCRAAAGACDVAESCTGTSASCPADAFEPATVVCRPSAGICDVAESCTGTGADCPGDSVAGAFVVCRAAAGPCDLPESCDGTNTSCPADALAPSTTTCRGAAGVCDLAESCTGTTTACPADAKSTAVCRAASGGCDLAESCPGTSDTCPGDAFEPGGTTCRAAAGFCDVAEVCTGISAACPADVFLPDGTPCNDNDACTTPDSCQSGVCTGTSAPETCADHFLCYKAKATPTFTPVAGVHLVDQFEDVTATVLKPATLCTPADKNGEGITDANTHLKAYAIRQTPPHVRRTNLQVDNQFGTLRVDTVKSDLLLVPANKSHVTPPSAPNENAIDVNHYKCYRIKVTSGTPKFARGVQAQVADQFISPAKTFDLKKPRHLCTPVEVNGESAKEPTVHLLCYQAKPAKGQPRLARSTVFVNNQFGPGTMTTIKESELCVPSLKTVLP